MKDITIYPSRRRQVFLAGLNLIFLYLSFETCRMYWQGNTFFQRSISVVLALLTLIFVFNTVFRIRDLFKNNFIFKLTEDGFYDRTAPLELEADYISWEMIEEIDIKFFNIQGFISIYLKDNEDFIEKASWYRKPIIRQNLDKGFGAISISRQVAQDILLLDLSEELNKRLEASRKNK